MTGLSVDCAEVRLVCGLVGGTRGPFTVPIAKTLQVGQLKEKIKGMCGIAPGADIQLFSTKTADGWMKVSAAISHLEDGTTDEAIDDIICSRKIDVWLTVDEALGEVVTGDVIHVLAKMSPIGSGHQ
ncbi:hypothetical protein Poli38472_005919 [Pythium oligandrum]|uniref:Crinkler effector protein N-terminal domain-containing protein n=1 Tax=Pythium oligandrum TaxID=41045 RepID=A0A8K1CRF6_PYTOL|nr:hypothetical protein Poli38472_005919 [Pythium oligandrum]|eukprot:TMW68451.1 hypothetical protein Poli38472_005919 [Pythium oligandrum]